MDVSQGRVRRGVALCYPQQLAKHYEHFARHALSSSLDQKKIHIQPWKQDGIQTHKISLSFAFTSWTLLGNLQDLFQKKNREERSLLLLCMLVAENGGKILWCFKTWFANHLSIWGALTRQILVIIFLSWLEKNEEVGGQNKLLGWNHKLALSLPCNAHRAPRRALLNPIFFLMNPHKGSIGSWVQEEDRGVQQPYIPSPSLERVCHVKETRMHSAGAIKKTLTSLGPNIGAIMMLGWEVSIYPPFISC